MTLVTTLEKIDNFFGAGFENRNGRVVPLQCQFERRNLRSHEKKFTGPRGSKNFWSSESHQASMNGRVVTEVDEVKIARNETRLLNILNFI